MSAVGCGHAAGIGDLAGDGDGEQFTASIMGALMSYVLVPAGPSTRLLLKVVVADRNLAAVALGLGDLPMARKQLRTLARLAAAGGAE